MQADKKVVPTNANAEIMQRTRLKQITRMAMLRDKGVPLPQFGTHCIYNELLQSNTLHYAIKALGIWAYLIQLRPRLQTNIWVVANQKGSRRCKSFAFS